jgi:hypothetical protein
MPGYDPPNATQRVASEERLKAAVAWEWKAARSRSAWREERRRRERVERSGAGKEVP